VKRTNKFGIIFEEKKKDFFRESSDALECGYPVEAFLYFLFKKANLKFSEFLKDSRNFLMRRLLKDIVRKFNGLYAFNYQKFKQ
jgi:hypothetical protein